MEGVNFMQIVSFVLHIVNLVIICGCLVAGIVARPIQKRLKIIMILSTLIVVLSLAIVVIEMVFMDKIKWLMLIIAILYIVLMSDCIVKLKNIRELKKIVEESSRIFESDANEEGL